MWETTRTACSLKFTKGDWSRGWWVVFIVQNFKGGVNPFRVPGIRHWLSAVLKSILRLRKAGLQSTDKARSIDELVAVMNVPSHQGH